MDPNGCGPSYFGVFVPDDIAGIMNFKDACDHHDIDYENINLSKETADMKFYNVMKQSCESQHTGVDNQRNISKYDAMNLSQCLDWADMYYSFVRDYGHSYWKKSQEKSRMRKIKEAAVWDINKILEIMFSQPEN